MPFIFFNWYRSFLFPVIHPDIVLTAAHCNEITSNGVIVNAYELDNPNTPGARIRAIVDRSVHPQYSAITVAYDFMVLKIAQPVTDFEPIKINRDSSVPATGQDLTVIGLGLTSDGGDLADTLREVNVTTVSDRECNEAFFGEIIEDVMLCAGTKPGGKDACQGDSGGPIFSVTESGSVDKQVGVVSWGFGCGEPGVPGVYAEISAVEEWISNQICALSDDRPDDCPEPTPPPTPTPPGPGEITVVVNVVTDSYPNEISWELLDEGGEVLAGVGQGDYNLPSHSYDTPVNLKINDTYTFTIFDLYGDGLCCGGSYEVSTDSAVLARGSSFGSIESTTFVVREGSWIPTPPPTSEGNVPITISVMTDSFPYEVSWVLYNDQGNLVESAPQGTYTFDQYLYTTTLNLENDTEYIFTISDSSGDGLCCAYGNGYYEITTPGGNDSDAVLLAYGADFGSVETSKFVPGGGGSTPPPTPPPPPTTPPPLPPDDQCEDTDGSIVVDSVVGQQPCSWLATKLELYGYLCQFVDVARVCPSTCNSCSLFVCDNPSYFDDDGYGYG